MSFMKGVKEVQGAGPAERLGGDSALIPLLQKQLTMNERAEVLAVARKILASKQSDQLFKMEGPAQAADYLRLWLGDLPNEAVAVVFLDDENQVIAREIPFQAAGDNPAEIEPRVVLERTLHHRAASIVVAHSHPRESDHPTASDKASAQQLKKGLALVDVRLIDYFVIPKGAPVSLAQYGWA